uniref:Cytochrome P450 family 8 subfamily B member 1, tandem duplicate 3 n=1 Tax=Fundulus heteroclitus TaxID=8078 RepID=A0A3Q2PBZ1_FUNHE
FIPTKYFPLRLVLCFCEDCLVALLGGLYVLGVFRKQRPGEPPLDKGLIPWLGHVLEFRRDTFKFLERMRQKHGDVFTVQLGGFYFTFLQDPFSFGAFVKESREKLDFNSFAEQLVYRVFGYKAVENDHHVLHNASNKHLKGEGLEVMTQAMMSNLQNLMLHSVGSATDQSPWKEDGLFMYSYNIVFRAGFLALFGNVPHKSEGGEEKAKEKDRTHSETLFYEFRKYDQLFPNLAYGVLPPKQKWEADRLQSYFWDAVSVQNMKAKDNISRWVWDMQQAKEEVGMDESMINKYMFVLLWASQGNTGPSSFGPSLLLSPRLPQTYAAHFQINLRSLTATGKGKHSLARGLDLLYQPWREQGKHVNSLKYFKTSNFIFFLEFFFCLITVKLTLEEWIHWPEEAKEPFIYYNMPWGAGVSMCPGRFFATNELKQFVFLMLVYFEFELKNPNEEIPEIDFRRWGFGSMQPIRDVQFRYRLRF